MIIKEIIFQLKIIILLCLFNYNVECYRTKLKIYENIESQYFCFRRLNGTNQIGCNSKESGNSGIVYYVQNETDMNYVINEGPHNPYITVIPVKLLNMDTLVKFRDSDSRVTGVIVIDKSTVEPPSEGYSPDSLCPNENFGLYTGKSKYAHCSTQQWNRKNPGADIMYNDWPFPIFLIKNQTDIKDLEICHERNIPNADNSYKWPLCAAQLSSAMYGAKDSETCIRRGNYASISPTPPSFCDPIGGTNIFTPLFATSGNTPLQDRSMIIIGTRLDSYSIFDNLSPGGDSVFSSLITTLSLAHTLASMREEININRGELNNLNVLFAFFDAEAFDYIGSSKTIYDMTEGNAFPVTNDAKNQAQIRLNHISHFIELNQLASHDLDKDLWIHQDVYGSAAVTKLQSLILKYSSSNVSIKNVSDTFPLPPSSVQNFLKKDSSIAGIVISNHEKVYINKYYNSFLDDYSYLNRSDPNMAHRFASIVNVMSSVIYEMLTNKTRNDAIQANVTIIEELIECYLNNFACDTFKYVSSPKREIKKDYIPPYQSYASVHRQGTITIIRDYTRRILAYLTGETFEVSDEDECNKMADKNSTFSYFSILANHTGIKCIKSQTVVTDAISPAYLNDDYKSTEWPIWTESQWRISSARIFLKPSPAQEWLTLITGILILILSFIIVWFIRLKASIIFCIESDDTEGNNAERTLTVAGC